MRAERFGVRADKRSGARAPLDEALGSQQFQGLPRSAITCLPKLGQLLGRPEPLTRLQFAAFNGTSWTNVGTNAAGTDGPLVGPNPLLQDLEKVGARLYIGGLDQDIGSLQPGKAAKMTVLRKSQETTLEVNVGKRPSIKRTEPQE